MFIELDPTNHSTASSSTDSNDSPTGPFIIDIDMSNNDIIIENVQVEDNLISYTDNHFTNKANIDLQRIRNLDENLLSLNLTTDTMYVRNCDSPITIHGSPPESVYDSKDGSCENSDVEDNSNIRNRSTNHTQSYKSNKYNYNSISNINIEHSMENYYHIDNKLSCEIDILTTYMRGQKHLFIQSKQLTQWQLNCLTIPSILITSFLSIGTTIIPSDINLMVISVLNGIIALLIALTKLMKFESYIETYLQLANQYDKMETILEMTNSKLVLLDNEEDKRKLVLQRIKEIEERMTEINESNNVFIPVEITALFPIICHINIFSFINKMETQKKELVIYFNNVKKEIHYILKKWDNEDRKNVDINTSNYKKNERAREENRIQYLYEIKRKIKVDLNDYRNVYGHMDNLFTREIKRVERKTNTCGIFYLCFWRMNQSSTSYRGLNPIIDKYFEYIATDE